MRSNLLVLEYYTESRGVHRVYDLRGPDGQIADHYLPRARIASERLPAEEFCGSQSTSATFTKIRVINAREVITSRSKSDSKSLGQPIGRCAKGQLIQRLLRVYDEKAISRQIAEFMLSCFDC